MSVERMKRRGGPVYRVRWREHGRNRARTFDRRRDAELWEAEVRRRRQLGTLHLLEAGRETLDDFIALTWAPTYAGQLAPVTRSHYTALYDNHLSPVLGNVHLQDLTPELVSRWQADRLAARCGPVAVRHALELLGSVLQRAVEGGRIATNPVRSVRKAPRPIRTEVRPLAPITVERMRASAAIRDAALIAVLAYAGLRPGEALALHWGDVRDRTLLVERAISLGEEKDTKTRRHRTVRLLGPLRSDLSEWKLASGRPDNRSLVFPSQHGTPWSRAAYQSWRRRAFSRAVVAAGLDHARPYDLRHSFASLLLYEGRNVIYVARQLGHDARLTLTTYGHVIDELDGAEQVDAEGAIRTAREAFVPARYPPGQVVAADH